MALSSGDAHVSWKGWPRKSRTSEDCWRIYVHQTSIKTLPVLNVVSCLGSGSLHCHLLSFLLCLLPYLIMYAVSPIHFITNMTQYTLYIEHYCGSGTPSLSLGHRRCGRPEGQHLAAVVSEYGATTVARGREDVDACVFVVFYLHSRVNW